MELESVFDGVSGWSGVGTARSPLVMPGDSFIVSFTPPRAGTYMYHTHMDEEDQMASGLYAPMLVLEPGERFDPSRDIVLTFGAATAVAKPPEFVALNGSPNPAPLELQAGVPYRFRIINIHPVAPARFEMVKDTIPVQWRAISKDGAALRPSRVKVQRASVLMGVGETYDFELAPEVGAMTFRVISTGGPAAFRIELPIRIVARR
jgi:FtsP/CotA-like multicopper oxidase with cupredoxin domain